MTGTGPTDASGRLRLLPWTGEEGKPCYLLGDGHGPLSRAADGVESVQLGMAAQLLGHAEDMMDDERTGAIQIRYLAARLTEALRDVHRVAESRGARLAGSPHHEDGPAGVSES